MKNQKENYTYHKEGANLSVLKIEGSHYFCCGINMANTTPEDTKTRHHSIPEEMNPIRNIVLPICRKCHGKLHTSQSLTNHDNSRLKKKLESMEKNFKALQKTLDNFREEVNK